MRPRRLLRLGVFLFSGYLALPFIAGVFVAEGTLHPGRRSLTAKDETLVQGITGNYDAELSDVTIPARDGVTLSAWSIQARKR